MSSTFLKALEITAKVNNPTAAAVSVALMLLFIMTRWISATKKSKKEASSFTWIIGISLFFLFLLGITPSLAKGYLKTHDVYAVRVVVLGADRSPVDNAAVVCSPGGEEKSIAGGWECDVPPRNRPADRRFTAYATVKSAFLAGHGELRLADDYNPVLTIQLQPDRSATVQGEVQGRGGRVLRGAWVSVVGHESERTQTREDGGFALPAHASSGQMIKLHVEAEGYPIYEGLQQAGDISISVQLVP